MTDGWFKEALKMKNMHLFFPKAVGAICVLLFIVIMIQRALRCKREGTPFINLKGYHFFKPGYDKVKFWGSVVLFIAYIACLPVIHFVPAGIIFVTLFNILFTNCINLQKIFGQKDAAGYDMPMVNKKDLLISLVIGVVISVFLWALFFKVFNITLP